MYPPHIVSLAGLDGLLIFSFFSEEVAFSLNGQTHLEFER
jgi:hypothetical protein